MAVEQWWRGRLVEGTPFWLPAHRLIPMHMWPYRDKDHRVIGNWPRAVHPTTLYEDYLVWFEMEYVKAFDAPYYKDFPERVPMPMAPMAFFKHMSRYIDDHRRQRLVPTVKNSMYKWVNVLRTRGYRDLPALVEATRRYNALHPDARVEAADAIEPGGGARRVTPWDAGSAL